MDTRPAGKKLRGGGGRTIYCELPTGGTKMCTVYTQGWSRIARSGMLSVSFASTSYYYTIMIVHRIYMCLRSCAPFA